MEPTRFMILAEEYREKYQNALIEIGNLEREIGRLTEEARDWKRKFYAMQQATAGSVPEVSEER